MTDSPKPNTQHTAFKTACFTLAGFYRVPWRALSSGALITRALVEEWVWGMEAVTELTGRARGRQLPPLLRALGAQVGPAADLRHPLHLHNPQNRLRDLRIGAQTHLGKACLLDLTAPVTIGDAATLAMRVMLLTHFDAYLSPLRLGPYPSSRAAVVVEDGAYLGAGAVILPGVRVGRCAVVAAGAVVTRDVPPFTVAAGVPARVIKDVPRGGWEAGD